MNSFEIDAWVVGCPQDSQFEAYVVSKYFTRKL